MMRFLEKTYISHLLRKLEMNVDSQTVYNVEMNQLTATIVMLTSPVFTHSSIQEMGEVCLPCSWHRDSCWT